MKNKKLGFSIVEVIIVVSILIVISVIAITSTESMKDKSNNSKVVSDIETLKNGLTLYGEEYKEYPTPNGNLKFYKDDGTYSHSYEDAFGVSGFFTENILPSKYINNIPLDPRLGQYYGYARTKSTLNFEIAGVVSENNKPKSFVSGNWRGEFGVKDLVREYAGPDFVFNNSTEFFPYNPYERVLIAKVSNYSGEVLINDKNLTREEILNYVLKEGDKISVGTGGTVSLHYSDGSSSMLGDTKTKSEMILANMRFTEDNNLFTSIKLALNIGSLWTKASKLGNKSSFEVYTADTMAAVRGTIFGVKKEQNNSQVVVKEGKVEVRKIALDPSENIIDKIKSGQDIGNPITDFDVGVITVENGRSYIEVSSGSGAKGIKVDSGSAGSYTSSTEAIESLPQDAKDDLINGIPELGKNTRVEIREYNKNRIAVKITPTLKKASKLAYTHKNANGTISTGSIENTGTTAWVNTGVLFLTGGSFGGQDNTTSSSTPVLNGEYKLSFCNEKICTKEVVLNIDNHTNYHEEKQFVDTCEKEIDEIYSRFFGRKLLKYECEEYLKDNNFLSKTREEKEEEIKSKMKGDDCIIYQKNHGNLNSGTRNCKSLHTKINGEKVENLLAGEGYDVVAYVPYNSDGVLDMHSTQGSISRIEASSEYILNNSAPLNNLIHGVDFYNTGHSFVKMNNGVRGIFVDNNNGNDGTTGNDYIKYDISDLSLNSSNGFAIEISVRGEALRRDSGTHYLFSTDWTQPGSGLSLKMFSSGGILLGSSVGALVNQVIPLEEIKNKISNDKFYKVIALYEGQEKLKIYVYDGLDRILIGRDYDDIRSINVGDLKYLYIGSRYDGRTHLSQWNDVIDYVKIYIKRA